MPPESLYAAATTGPMRLHWGVNLDDACAITGVWRIDYNENRPHSSLGYRPPAPVTLGQITTLEPAPAMQ
jgi:hypothetical protein